jgi:hypothetical protein
MRRTTLALAEEVVRLLRERALRERTSMTALANRLLCEAVRQPARPARPAFKWKTFDCGPPLVDINDREALYDAMER